MEIVFKEFRDRFLVFFGCLGSRFSDFLGLENKLENETIFYENQISDLDLVGQIRGYLGPLKT